MAPMADAVRVRRLLLPALLGLLACNAPRTQPARAPAPAAPPLQPQPAVTLSGTFSDGTPLTLAALKGRPWVVNLWLPG